MAWRKRPRPGARDEASVHVLEAILLGLILLGAAYSVTTMREGGAQPARARVNLQALADDALVVLAGLNDSRGNFMELFLAEAIHCASDPHPSAEDCDGARGENLSLKLASYLPQGVGYMYAIGNGVEERVLFRSTLPDGEAVTASRTFTPNWNATFMTPELSCYEPGMDVNVTMVPLWHGDVVSPRYANGTSGTLKPAGVRDDLGMWNFTLPAASRGAAAKVLANVSGTTSRNGTFPGATSYTSCDLQGVGASIVGGLRASTFRAAEASAALSTDARFAFDLAPLLAVPGISLVSANVTVYDPLPPFGPDAGRYVPAAVIDLSSPTGEAAWPVPAFSLYGAHPVKLTAKLQVGGATFEAYRVEVIDVALPSGDVPIDPPYRMVLQVWFPDWR